MKQVSILLLSLFFLPAAYAATNNPINSKEKAERKTTITKGFTLAQLARKAVEVATAQKETELPLLPIGTAIYKF